MTNFGLLNRVLSSPAWPQRQVGPVGHLRDLHHSHPLQPTLRTARFQPDIFGSHRPDAFTAITQQELARTGQSRWLVINISGVKQANDTFPGGHIAGNAYLQNVYNLIKQAALRTGIQRDQLVIVRDGPNYAINVPSLEIGRTLMQQLTAATNKGIEINYEHKRHHICRTLRPQDIEGNKQALFNLGLMAFTAKELAHKETALYRGLREMIYFLNRPETVGYRERVNNTTKINLQSGQRLADYDLTSMVQGYETIRASSLDALAKTGRTPSYCIDPRSGLHNHVALLIDAAKIIECKSPITFAFFDINAMGAFRSLGFVGEAMMEAIIEVRLAQAAVLAGLPADSIKLYRHGAGSEEFYLLANGREINTEKMQACIKNFMAALNDPAHPFIMKVATRDLAATEAGQRYLAAHEATAGAEYQMVDLSDIIRGRGGHNYRGITITTGYGMINPPKETRNTTLFLMRKMAAITEYGENAKTPERRNVMVEVTRITRNGQNVRQGTMLPLPVRLGNPRPIPGQPLSQLDQDYAENREIILPLPA